VDSGWKNLKDRQECLSYQSKDNKVVGWTFLSDKSQKLKAKNGIAG
jgi:hypothetical protein